jgi:hypothetical protein
MASPTSLKKTVELALLDIATQRILYWFFAYPETDFSLTDLCKETKTAKTTAKLVVEHLEKMGFLEKKVYGRLWRLSARHDHPYFATRKIPGNLQMVYESGIIEDVLRRYPQARAIVLFGSYRKGDDVPESDIDIAVELPGKEPLRIKELGSITNFGYRRDVRVNAHLFSRESVDINVFANIVNGIVLWGFLEVAP